MARQPELFDEDAGRSAWTATTPFEDCLSNADYEVSREFLSSPPGSKQSWTTIPASEINRLWNEYAKWGRVGDHEALARVIEQFKENVAKLSANSELCGHGTSAPDYEDLGLDENDQELMERFYYWVTEISDYGTGPLINLAFSLDEAKSAEEALLILDRMLGVVHQRSDLSALFVEGGSKTLDQLFSQKGPLPSFSGPMRSQGVPAIDMGTAGPGGRTPDWEQFDRPNVWPGPSQGPSAKDVSAIPQWWKKRASTWLERAAVSEFEAFKVAAADHAAFIHSPIRHEVGTAHVVDEPPEKRPGDWYNIETARGDNQQLLFRILSFEKEDPVSCSAARNLNCPPEALRAVLDRGLDNWLSRDCARNPSCPHEALADVLRRGKEDMVSIYAVDNPRCPPWLLAEVLSDPRRGGKDWVSLKALLKPQCPPEAKTKWRARFSHHAA